MVTPTPLTPEQRDELRRRLGAIPQAEHGGPHADIVCSECGVDWDDHQTHVCDGVNAAVLALLDERDALAERLADCERDFDSVNQSVGDARADLARVAAERDEALEALAEATRDRVTPKLNALAEQLSDIGAETFAAKNARIAALEKVATYAEHRSAGTFGTCRFGHLGYGPCTCGLDDARREAGL